MEEQSKEETNKMTIVILQARLRWYFYLDGSVVVVGGDVHVSALYKFIERVAG